MWYNYGIRTPQICPCLNLPWGSCRAVAGQSRGLRKIECNFGLVWICIGRVQILLAFAVECWTSKKCFFWLVWDPRPPPRFFAAVEFQHQCFFDLMRTPPLSIFFLYPWTRSRDIFSSVISNPCILKLSDGQIWSTVWQKLI